MPVEAPLMWRYILPPAARINEAARAIQRERLGEDG